MSRPIRDSCSLDRETGQLGVEGAGECGVMAGDNKSGLYRQCVGARIGGGMWRKMFADALLIRPVVLSRGRLLPLMGIECSSAFDGRLRMVAWPRLGVSFGAVGG
jgi:hypothetical protein